MDIFCWVCRYCKEESKFCEWEEEIPPKWIDSEEFGVVCEICAATHNIEEDEWKGL